MEEEEINIQPYNTYTTGNQRSTSKGTSDSTTTRGKQENTGHSKATIDGNSSTGYAPGEVEKAIQAGEAAKEATLKTWNDNLPFNPNDPEYLNRREKEDKNLAWRRKMSGLHAGLSTLADMGIALAGGNVYRREKDNTDYDAKQRELDSQDDNIKQQYNAYMIKASEAARQAGRDAYSDSLNAATKVSKDNRTSETNTEQTQGEQIIKNSGTSSTNSTGNSTQYPTRNSKYGDINKGYESVTIKRTDGSTAQYKVPTKDFYNYTAILLRKVNNALYSEKENGKSSLKDQLRKDGLINKEGKFTIEEAKLMAESNIPAGYYSFFDDDLESAYKKLINPNSTFKETNTSNIQGSGDIIGW